MSYQWIVDNANALVINRVGIVSQTVSRDQGVRSVSRGGKIFKFKVTPSPGLLWTNPEVRAAIGAIENANRYTVVNISFNKPSLKYILGYMGNVTGAQTASVTRGATTFTVSGGTISNGYRFRSGDIIQFAANKTVYSVAADVPYNSSSVTVTRPIQDNTGTYTVITGQSVSFSVICTILPEYKITPLGIIEWSGDFEFSEVIQ